MSAERIAEERRLNIWAQVTPTEYAATLSRHSKERLRIVHTALDAVPCCCSDAYYERGMVAPGCEHHDLAYELREWAVCTCTPCQRLEASQ